MAIKAIPQRKRLAMGEEPRSDPRSGGLVVPRPFGGSREPKEPADAKGLNGSEKPTLESRAGVTHAATDVGRRVGRTRGNP